MRILDFLSRERARARAANTRWFEMSNAMLGEASLDGYFTRLNEQWERKLGWTREELVSRPYLELVHLDDVEATVAAARMLAEAPADVVGFENRYLTKDGSWCWLLWTVRSDAERIYAVAEDVTERKLLEGRTREVADPGGGAGPNGPAHRTSQPALVG